VLRAGCSLYDWEIENDGSMNKRPLSVTMIGYLYIAMGAIGFVYHSSEFRAGEAFRYDMLGIELIRLVAVVCGIFMLREHNWARWLALAWIGFHAILSAFHTLPELAIHCLFFAVIAWCLVRPDATRCFRAHKTDEHQHGDTAGR
jgi:glucose uptake protein GlcU